MNKLIESTKKDYFKKRLTNSSNSKESWQAINELLNRKPKPTQVNQIIEDDKIITNNKDTRILSTNIIHLLNVSCLIILETMVLIP